MAPANPIGLLNAASAQVGCLTAAPSKLKSSLGRAVKSSSRQLTAPLRKHTEAPLRCICSAGGSDAKKSAAGAKPVRGTRYTISLFDDNPPKAKPNNKKKDAAGRPKASGSADGATNDSGNASSSPPRQGGSRQVKNNNNAGGKQGNDSNAGARVEESGPITREGPDRVPLEEIRRGKVLDGRVRACFPFGCIVDVGASQDGLLHVSEIGERKPTDRRLERGTRVRVRVIAVDARRKTLRLSLKSGGKVEQRRFRLKDLEEGQVHAAKVKKFVADDGSESDELEAGKPRGGMFVEMGCQLDGYVSAEDLEAGGEYFVPRLRSPCRVEVLPEGADPDTLNRRRRIAVKLVPRDTIVTAGRGVARPPSSDSLEGTEGEGGASGEERGRESETGVGIKDKRARRRDRDVKKDDGDDGSADVSGGQDYSQFIGVMGKRYDDDDDGGNEALFDDL
eukprot:jgi/Mesvir1/22397/Mv17885-RA.1